MEHAKTALKNPYLKHVFIDIVRFTQNRSTDIQADVITTFNSKITEALKELGILSNDSCIKLPTGDGVCLSIKDLTAGYDIHVRLALSILRRLHEHNVLLPEEDANRIHVRIGINEHFDLVVTDINHNDNVAGDGINIAQRTMNFGDGGHLMVAGATFKQLHKREEYLGCFIEYVDYDKHGEKHRFYQYIAKQPLPGLTRTAPLGKDKNKIGEVLMHRIKFIKAGERFKRLFLDWRVDAEWDRARSIDGGSTHMECRAQYESMVYYFRKILGFLEKGDYFRTVSSLKFWSSINLDIGGFITANHKAIERGVNVKRIIVLDKRIVIDRTAFDLVGQDLQPKVAIERGKLIKLLRSLAQLRRDDPPAFEVMEFTFYLADDYDTNFKPHIPLAVVGQSDEPAAMCIKGVFDDATGEPNAIQVLFTNAGSGSEKDAFIEQASTFDTLYKRDRHTIDQLAAMLGEEL